MATLTFSVLLILAQPAPADPAETIRVDRGLQVTVFPDRIRLQYELGLSPLAATSLLKQKSIDLPADADRRALMEAFRDEMLPDIQRRCRVMADGIQLELRSVESQLFPKHYVQLSCIFEASLPTSGKSLRLQLVDGSFRGCDGNHLIALKSASGVRLESSTVPLILARVPRESLSNDSAAHREAARRAEAVVLRPDLPIESSEATPAVPPIAEPDHAEPALAPAGPAAARTMNTIWVVGFCLGVLIVMLVCWRRTRP